MHFGSRRGAYFCSRNSKMGYDSWRGGSFLGYGIRTLSGEKHSRQKAIQFSNHIVHAIGSVGVLDVHRQ